MTHRQEVYHRMAKDAVGAGLSTLVALLLLEGAEPGFVAAFFNMNWLVLWVFGASLIAFATHPPSHESSASPSSAIFWLLVGLAATWFVWASLPADLKPLWRGIAAGGTFLVSLLALSLLKKE